jgi:hypothetical protein
MVGGIFLSSGESRTGDIEVTQEDKPVAEIIRRLLELESVVRYHQPPAPGETGWGFDAGRIPVLLSAPHAAAHTRDGKPKEEDEYTAGLARLIAELTGAHALYACRESAEDPNWHLDTAYKRELARIVQEAGIGFVLDIHGAVTHTDFGIALGTINGQSCPAQYELILDILHGFGFREEAEGLNRLDIDDAYSARGAGTITRFVSQQLKVPAAQFEINGHLRIVKRRDDATKTQPFYGDPWRIEHTVRAFVALVDALAASVSGQPLNLDDAVLSEKNRR